MISTEINWTFTLNSIARTWGTQLGLCNTRVDRQAAQVDDIPVQTENDATIDTVLKSNSPFLPNLKAELGLAHKIRSPSYQETYL